MRRAARSAALAAVILIGATTPAATGSAAAPVSFGGLSVAPHKAVAGQRGAVRIAFRTEGATGDVLVRVLGPQGEVRRFEALQLAPGSSRTIAWDGLDAAGVPVADDTYRVTIGEVGGPEQQAGSVILSGHYFPVRGRHGTRGGIGTFHAPRNGGRIHEGFDVTGNCGTPLAAVRTGSVIRKGYDPVLYGNFIEIRGLGERQSYFYAHMVKASRFARGDRVPTAAFLGRIGRTGNAAGTPCHLHFEIHLGGRPVDPAPQLRRWDRVS